MDDTLPLPHARARGLGFLALAGLSVAVYLALPQDTRAEALGSEVLVLVASAVSAVTILRWADGWPGATWVALLWGVVALAELSFLTMDLIAPGSYGPRATDILMLGFLVVPIRSIYSSPLERAIETAPIAKSLGLTIQKERGLLETNVGDWQGKSLKRLYLHKHWRVVQRAPSRAQFPNGETFHECQNRIVSTLDVILSKHKVQDIVACVFHADPIKLAVAHYIGLPLDQFQRLGCDTGSVSALAIAEMGANLVKLNQRPPFDFLPKRK